MSDERRARDEGPADTPAHDADRRAMLKTASVLLGAALLPAGLAACGERASPATKTTEIASYTIPAPTTARMATAQDEAVLAVVAEAMYPPTSDSPGAIAAGVPPVVTRLLNECWNDETRGYLLGGLDAFLARCQATHGQPFQSLTPDVRLALLAEEDAAALPLQGTHWFNRAYDAISRAYWTSEPGATQALRWIAVPGRWVGCTPLEPGQPAWL